MYEQNTQDFPLFIFDRNSENLFSPQIDLYEHENMRYKNI